MIFKKENRDIEEANKRNDFNGNSNLEFLTEERKKLLQEYYVKYHGNGITPLF